MSVASMLENMKRRALDSTYDAYICEEYDAWGSRVIRNGRGRV